MPGSRYQVLEYPLLIPHGGQIFRVPLDPHDKGMVAMFNGLDHAGIVVCADQDAVAQPVDSLPVQAVHHGLIAEPCPQSRTGLDSYPLAGRHGPKLAGLAIKPRKIGVQAATAMDVDKLRTPTDSEDRNPGLERRGEARLLTQSGGGA
jgi:hypothetical protein